MQSGNVTGVRYEDDTNLERDQQYVVRDRQVTENNGAKLKVRHFTL